MARIYFVAFFISFFCLQWTLSEGEGAFQIYIGNCEDTEHDVFINFSNVGFTKIGDHLINSPRVSCLSLSNNEISEVSREAFDLLPNLLYLDVSNNYIEKHKLFCVGEGTNITTLVLDNNVIRNRPTYTTTPYYDNYYGDSQGAYWRKLGGKRRWMSHSHQRHTTGQPIHHQPNPGCSLDFPNLKHIYARGCNLHTNDMAYLHAPNLTHLYLSANNIDSLDFLDPLLLSVTHIYLDRNNIVGLKSRSLSKHILHLDLSFNNIQYLCNEFCNDMGMSFSGATNLRYLSLAGNKIANIETDTFDDIINLTVLDLSKNRITGFKKGTFDSLSSLENLSLSHNNLKVVPEIYSLLSLKNLNLSFNNIQIISSMRIARDAKLQSIDLSNNNISFIADDTFINVTSLVHLNLSQNKLLRLSQNWTTPLSNLKVLHIGGTHFENLASLHLINARKLTDLYLDDNAVTTLSAFDLYNISPNLSLHITKQYYDSGHICQCGP